MYYELTQFSEDENFSEVVWPDLASADGKISSFFTFKAVKYFVPWFRIIDSHICDAYFRLA